MADLRLDGAERAPRPPIFIRRTEHRRQAARLGSVTGLGRGPMSLDEFDRGRAVVGVLVRTTKRFGLTFGAGRVHTGSLPIRRRSEAANDCIDLVAVTLRILQTTEREHPYALPNQRSVRIFGERAAVSRRRERGRLREAHVHQDVVQCVHTTRDDHVAVAQIQLVQPGLKRRNGAGACGVRHEVRTPEVEPVRYTTRNHVSQEAGERAFLPRLVVVLDELDDLLNPALRKARLTKRVAPDRVMEP